MSFSTSFHWLITGGAGFIGSHLAHALVAQGQRVTILDNLSSGNRNNLTDIQDKICFLEGDICDMDTVSQACRGVDYILHHAALVSVEESVKSPQKTAQINVQGTLHVLEAARQNKVKRVVFASSAAVYGNSPALPYTEQTPTDCQSPYAWSKQAAADLCQLYTRLYGVETVVLRYFNVFGIGQNPHAAYSTVIAKFIQLAAQKKPLRIDWDGLQSRDFVAVEDVVQANLLAATKAAPGEIYNVASGQTHTLLELADTIEKIAGCRLERVFAPKRPGDVHDSSADITKLSDLGFVPRVGLEQGLTAMWKHRENQDL